MLYAVGTDGQVRWYRHKGYQTGAVDWEGPKIVQVGWTRFKTMFSAGDGDIYGVTTTGQLIWTRHGGWASGGGVETWWKPLVVATGWEDSLHVFASMPGPPTGSDIR